LQSYQDLAQIILQMTSLPVHVLDTYINIIFNKISDIINTVLIKVIMHALKPGRWREILWGLS